MGDYISERAKADAETDVIERAEKAEQGGKRQVWERMDGESAKAYAAFSKYRDMAERRTMAKVATMSQCSAQNIHRWARRHNWTQRCYEFDLVSEERLREQTLRDRIAHRRRQVTIGQHYQSVALAGLRELQVKIASGVELNLEPTQIAALHKLGDQLESQGLGQDREGASSRYTRIIVRVGRAEDEPDDAPAASSSDALSDDTTGEGFEVN